MDYQVYLHQALRYKKNYKSHLRGNVNCTVTEGMACMDIRQYWKPYIEDVPMKRGFCFRPLEYAALKGLVWKIGKALPELDGVISCYAQRDCMNKLGALQCSKCTPN